MCEIMKAFTVKPVLVATSIKQATCIKQACEGKHVEILIYVPMYTWMDVS